MTKLLALSILSLALHAADDPRLKIDRVQKCVDNAKAMLTSEQYSGRENEQNLIAACRESDPACVAMVAETLHPMNRPTTPELLSLIRQCHGVGAGKCFEEVESSVPSFERKEVAQISSLLRKCE